LGAEVPKTLGRYSSRSQDVILDRMCEDAPPPFLRAGSLCNAKTINVLVLRTGLIDTLSHSTLLQYSDHENWESLKTSVMLLTILTLTGSSNLNLTLNLSLTLGLDLELDLKFELGLESDPLPLTHGFNPAQPPHPLHFQLLTFTFFFCPVKESTELVDVRYKCRILH